MLAELEDRRAFLRNRHASRFQRDPLPVLGRDRPVDVDLGAAVASSAESRSGWISKYAPRRLSDTHTSSSSLCACQKSVTSTPPFERWASSRRQVSGAVDRI
jgi:hypothetical protein